GTHYEGFHEAVLATVKAFAGNCHCGLDPQSPNTADANLQSVPHINLFSNLISPADIRHLKEITSDFGINAMLFPDYSDTLDGTSWDTYHRIPEGGTPLTALQNCGTAKLSIELGYILNNRLTAGEYLQNEYGIPNIRTGLPIGIRETDKFFALLNADNADGKEEICENPCNLRHLRSQKYEKQRGRLIDLYIDGHKYVSKKRAIIYGEEDLVIGLAAFAAEVGIIPVLCASGGESGKLEESLKAVLGDLYTDEINVMQGATFEQMETAIKEWDLRPDLLIGNSKGYYIARKLDIPLIRAGFPIHDRIGAAHTRLLGYEGTTILFEQIVNALLEDRQRKSPVGWKYM
ncbi:MAG: nitrogenase, partial [Prevotellaceae bacterium]|nr:nitrogenase [Prevotellaceae bacterium]